MTTQNNTEVVDSTSQVDENATPSFEQQANDLVSQMTKGGNGKWEFPEGVTITEELRFAAMAERRRRDTESAYGKTRLQLKTEQGVNEELKKRIAVAPTLSPADQERLDNLKYDDPEAWRQEMNRIEQSATASLQTELGEVTTTVSQRTEQEYRAELLANYNRENPDFPITDDVVQNDIPQRITRKLETGEITFSDFLHEANKFLTNPKIVGGGTQAKESPNLGAVAGGAYPAEHAVNAQTEKTYKQTVL